VANKEPGASIVGVGITEIGIVPGVRPMAFMAQAAKRAIEDAGVEKAEIDGLILVPSMVEPNLLATAQFCEYFGLRVTFSTQPGVAGANGAQAVVQAALAIQAGLATTVLIVGGDNTASQFSTGGAINTYRAFQDPHDVAYGLFAVSMYALAATRHQHLYGTTQAQIAEIAVACRRHAALHGNAHMRDPLTVEDVLNSRLICSPLHVLDCCLVSDGGAALVVTSSERARARRRGAGRARILGFGAYDSHDKAWLAPEMTAGGAAHSGERAFRQAGVGPSEIDVAEIYDATTVTTLILLEDLGFCAKGEGGAFVEGGAVQVGGRLPLNTHGGLLSQGQPGMGGGLLFFVEAATQLAGNGGARQVPEAKLAAVHGSGGMLGTNCTIILGRD
jgi:acetyl-CoA acetyltransferase